MCCKLPNAHHLVCADASHCFADTNGCKFETCLSEPVVEGGQVDPTIMAMDKVYFDSEQLDNALIQQVASSCAHIVDVIKKGSARCTVLLQMPKI